MFLQNAGPTALKQEKVECTGNDHAKRGKNRCEAAPATGAVDRARGQLILMTRNRPQATAIAFTGNPHLPSEKYQALDVEIVGRFARSLELAPGGGESAVAAAPQTGQQ